MPTLVRLLTILAVVCGLIYGMMAALVYFVQPTRTEVSVPVVLPEADETPKPATGAAPAAASDEGLSELRP
ncbi:hypothetical protein [Jiella sonneratiae]|uniref:hypothetical protein n=1 Tax=Jiella sonneratiae TaxID=2816856 RepID=UPI001FDA24FF|nr:hypothetical protein [Jiella sonneratiae]